MGNDLTVHAEYIKRARTRFISCLTVISRLLLCSHARGKSSLRDTIVTSLEMHKYPASHYRILPRALLSEEFTIALLQGSFERPVPMIPIGAPHH